MKSWHVPVSIVFLVSIPPQIASAEPAWTRDGDCMSCHGAPQPDLISVFGEDGRYNPVERAGLADLGELKVFAAHRGQTRRLSVVVPGLAAGDIYSVELTRLKHAGVTIANGTLRYGADCDWAEWGGSAGAYTDTPFGSMAGSVPPAVNYDITIQSDAAYDCYDLVMAVAGLRPSGDRFYGEEHFYLLVYSPGAKSDFDGDGDVDQDDFGHLQACLSGSDVPQSNPTCQDAKLDSDTDVDPGDVVLFHLCMSGSGNPADPDCGG